MYKLKNIRNDLKRDRLLLFMLIPPIIIVVLFSYIPMGGLMIAFKDYSVKLGIFGSEWVGFQYFKKFFESVFFWRLLRNTVVLSVFSLLPGLLMSIIFSLLLNEVRNKAFKKVVQTVSYMPHFVSLVVIVAMINCFFLPTGIINKFITAGGGSTIAFTSDPAWFTYIYAGSEIWQSFGWNSIIFLAAISSIDPILYQASMIDGAKRFKQMLHITLPCLLPTIMIVFIMQSGWIMSVGFEKIILMYSPENYETADVINTYVYRKGILGAQFSFATAIGLFNSVVNMIILFVMNRISGKITETSLF